jgi:hypothetical protein
MTKVRVATGKVVLPKFQTSFILKRMFKWLNILDLLRMKPKWLYRPKKKYILGYFKRVSAIQSRYAVYKGSN